MDIFYQKKLLKRFVILLVLLNILSWIIIWKKPNSYEVRPPKKDIIKLTQLLEKKLGLTETQSNKFQSIRLDFFKKESALADKIRSKRDSLNEQMFNKEKNDLKVNQLALRIAKCEYQMECYRIEQAQQLKLICTPKQIEKFHDLVLEIRDFLQPEKKK
jgi:Spy/CpxP family protein refolding chaperone